MGFVTRGLAVLLLALLAGLAGCGQDTGGASPDQGASPESQTAGEEADDPGDEQRYPDVVDVEATAEDDGTYSFAVTISSPYDTPERYTDGWRVMDADGTVYGEHTLMHDHADEQPFTRTQDGVEIPEDVSEVIVEGRDLEHGFGGETQTVTLP